MKKTILTITISIALSISAYAQSMQSLFIPTDPVATGLAMSTLAKDATAYSAADNASAMAFSETQFKGALSYGMWQPKVADSKTVNAGAFLKVNDRLSVGVSAKMLRSSIGPELSGTAIGGDLCAMYRKEFWSASVALCNLGTPITYGGKSYAMPVYSRAGGTAKLLNFTFCAEADYLFDGAFSAAAGAEYSVLDMFFARAGYHYGSSDKGLPSFAAIGCGVKFFGIELNLACLLSSETLKETVCFGLAYSF